MAQASRSFSSFLSFLLLSLPLASAAAIRGPPHEPNHRQPSDNDPKHHESPYSQPHHTGTYHGQPTYTQPHNGQPTCSSSGNSKALELPSIAPSDAPLAPGDFVGFGFETAFLPNYAVGSFSQNLVNSVAKRIPGPVTIRIGGTSGDRFEFNPDQPEIKVCIDGDCPVGSGASYILGPSYFDAFSAFPEQKFSFQARMGAELNLTAALEYVRRAYGVLGEGRTAAIALGNEPDLYAGQYGVAYGVQDYVRDGLELERRIVEALALEGEASKIFQIGELSGAGGNGFTIGGIFDAGINTNDLTKFAAQHWYQVTNGLPAYTPETQQQYLLSHTATTANWTSGFAGALAYVDANEPGVDYILSETGSALASPPREWQDGFAACLWAVDFNLFALSQGVKRVDGTHRPAAKHSLWVPDDSVNDPSLGESYNPGPEVRGPFFATPFVADFIGTGEAGRVVQVLGEDMFTGYAVYDAAGSGAVERVALVNLRYWGAGNGTRPSEVFALPVPEGVEAVSVRRLRAEAGAAAQGDDVDGTTITWAGETWSYAVDDGKGHLTGAPVEERVEVCGGVAEVEVPDSEAVIVYFGQGAGGDRQ